MRCRLARALVQSAALGALVAVPAGGCGEWPRYKNLPAADPDSSPSTTDPRSLITLTWVSVDESEDNDSSVVASQTTLPLGTGYEITGTLAGTGWYDLAEQTVISDLECGPGTGTRTPLPEGDYIDDQGYLAVAHDRRAREDAQRFELSSQWFHDDLLGIVHPIDYDSEPYIV